MKTKLSLGGRREDGRLQFVGLPEAGGKLVSVYFSGLLIGLPAGSGKIAAHNAFDGQRFCLADDNSTSFQLILPGGKLSREPGHITFDDMVGNNILKHIHPE